MAIYKLLDFKDIQDSIMEELKYQSTDTKNRNAIKRDINMVYLNEIVPFSRWKWLEGYASKVQKVFYGTGTASVTPQSNSVTLSLSPASSLGSFTGQWFGVDGFDEIYKITSHTATGTAITLESEYQGALNASAKFKIWSDTIALPTDLRETVEVWHDLDDKPMEGRGLQDFIKIRSRSGAKSEGRPFYYYTGDFEDPTVLTGESESDRYRVMRIFPAIHNQPTTVHINYVKEANALELDSDEPLMPVEDRIVLFYAAASRAWARERNESMSEKNFVQYQQKLTRMAGKVEDSQDMPALIPDSIYLSTKRHRFKGTVRRGFGRNGSGGSTANVPTYAKNITIEGAILTDDMTVSPGVTIDGYDLSVTLADYEAHKAASSGVHGVIGNVVGTTDTQTLTNKTLAVGSNSITGTASRIAQFNASGVLEPSSTISTSESTFLDDAEGLTSFSLVDNTADQVIASWTAASYDSVRVLYSLKRGASNVETGMIKLITDGSSAGIAVDDTNLGTLGVTFTSDVSGGSLRLKGSTTSTGTDATIKYKVIKWLA